MNIITRCWVESPVFGVIRMSQRLVAPMISGRILIGNPVGLPRIGIQPSPGMVKSVSGWERSWTQKKRAFRNSAACPSMLKSPKKIGI